MIFSCTFYWSKRQTGGGGPLLVHGTAEVASSTVGLISTSTITNHLCTRNLKLTRTERSIEPRETDLASHHRNYVTQKPGLWVLLAMRDLYLSRIPVNRRGRRRAPVVLAAGYRPLSESYRCGSKSLVTNDLFLYQLKARNLKSILILRPRVDKPRVYHTILP